jgi:ArsR family transcriptional regulator, arsenate/arsenite/antimonite-responsive transcriptional repressor
MDKIYKAISDGTRRTILKLLRERDMTAGELAGHFDLTKPTLSKHFAVLREAGLISDEKKGRNITYRLNPELLETALVSLMEDYSFVWTPPMDVEQAAGQFVESLVKGDFQSVAQDFDEAMADALPPDKLRETWDRVIAYHGPFIKQTDIRTERYWKYTTVIIACEFGKSKVNIKVTFSRSGQISGLLILEAQ